MNKKNCNLFEGFLRKAYEGRIQLLANSRIWMFEKYSSFQTSFSEMMFSEKSEHKTVKVHERVTFGVWVSCKHFLVIQNGCNVRGDMVGNFLPQNSASSFHPKNPSWLGFLVWQFPKICVPLFAHGSEFHVFFSFKHQGGHPVAYLLRLMGFDGFSA